MPLFMDIHHLPDGVTPEMIRDAHQADESIQERHGVTYQGYWYDPDGRTVSCLAHGPNKEACDAVHREAHGLVADRIIEVSPAVVSQFIGTEGIDPSGAALMPDGSRDPGLRVLLFTEVDNLSTIGATGGDAAAMKVLGRHDAIVRSALRSHGGREVRHTGDSFLLSFVRATSAVQCAMEIQAECAKESPPSAPRVRIGISAGEPVAEHENLFGVAVDQSRAMCRAAQPGEILASAAVRELCAGKGLAFGASGVVRLESGGVPVAASIVGVTAVEPPAGAARIPTDPAAHLDLALDGRYTIERELGRGGMARVYLAMDKRHERRVAIKVMNQELAAQVGHSRFLREIRVAAKLTHPNIVPLFDSGEAAGVIYFVMPELEGASLRDVIEREKPLAVNRALEIARGVAAALHYAHGAGVVHRDIKPDNILLHHGQPMVVDFGIALAVSAPNDPRLTTPGLAVGTPSYMSPEQIAGGESIDARSDVYALACVLFEMLAGEPPFTGPRAQAVFARVMSEPARDLSEHNAGVPRHVSAAVGRALAKSPDDRFSSAAEFASALAS
jgi:class 3 adenylate cyclase/tRNA A-37 threonylcarbamoyl transferase component Bud32